MKITDMNWMQVETYLKSDDRAVVPIGSTEQHAQLSLGVDLILSERVSVEAASCSSPPSGVRATTTPRPSDRSGVRATSPRVSSRSISLLRPPELSSSA